MARHSSLSSFTAFRVITGLSLPSLPPSLPALINISVCFCFLLRFILRTSFLYAHTHIVPQSSREEIVCLCRNFPPLSLSDSLLGRFYRCLPVRYCLLTRISPKIFALATRQVAWNSVADAYLNRSVGAKKVRKYQLVCPMTEQLPLFPLSFFFIYSFLSLSLSFFSALFRTVIPLTTPRGSIMFPLEIRNGSVYIYIYTLSKPVLIYSSHRCLINFLIVTFDRNVPRP